jgi:hypothetical protein
MMFYVHRHYYQKDVGGAKSRRPSHRLVEKNEKPQRMELLDHERKELTLLYRADHALHEAKDPRDTRGEPLTNLTEAKEEKS